MRLFRFAVLVLLLAALTGCGDDNPVRSGRPVGLISSLGSLQAAYTRLDSSRLVIAATGFRMPGRAFRLTHVALQMHWPVRLESLDVRLFRDVNGDPGQLVTPFLRGTGSFSQPFTSGPATFLPSTDVTLDAGATYWVVVHYHGPRTDMGVLGILWPGWIQADSGQTATGLATAVGTKYGHSMPTPPTADTTLVFQYAVYGSGL